MKCKILVSGFMSLVFMAHAPLTMASTSEHLHEKKTTKSAHSARQKLSAADQADVKAIFQANENLHSTFFASDMKKMAVEAKKVSEAISKLKNDEIKKLLTFAKGKLKKMEVGQSRENLNQDYHLVSMALIHILKKYDIGGDYNAYSCPMVKKKWVQNSTKQSKVHNPYSSEMPHCGTKDTSFKS